MRRAATESELRNAQRMAMDAAEQGAAQGKHRAAIANRTSDAARSIIPSAGDTLAEVAPGVTGMLPVIIGASVDAVSNAAGKAAYDAVKAGATPGMVAEAVRAATDTAIDFCIRGV